MVRHVIGAAAAAMLAMLAGCGPNYSPNTYNAAAVQQANKVTQGDVVGVREVRVSADATLGTVTGAAVGGIAGSQVDSGGPITALSTLGGTVIGGVVGNGVEHAGGDTTACEYIVRQNDGSLVSVTQRDKVPLALGEKVLVIAGKQARVVPDYTVALPGMPPPKPKQAATAKPPATPATGTTTPAPATAGTATSASAATMSAASAPPVATMSGTSAPTVASTPSAPPAATPPPGSGPAAIAPPPATAGGRPPLRLPRRHPAPRSRRHWSRGLRRRHRPSCHWQPLHPPSQHLAQRPPLLPQRLHPLVCPQQASPGRSRCQ